MKALIKSPAKRHKWDRKLKRGIVFATCLKCGCSKQRYYGMMLYFVEYSKDPFFTSPNCFLVKEKAVKPIKVI